MNIFILDKDPEVAARMHCDKHVVKMIVESAQMLSTTHRLLDGKLVEGFKTLDDGRKRKTKKWILADQDKDSIFYHAVHMNHPCTVWTMHCAENYEWHWQLFSALCAEYTHRYRKVHATETKLLEALVDPPQNIKYNHGVTQFPLAMKSNPECMHPDDPVRSYREFYQTKQSRFKMVWTNREKPEWFQYR